MAEDESKRNRLPTPTERPQADVVIYDGECRFCSGQVQRLARWDKAGRLAYLSLHDPEVSRRYPDLSYQQLMDAMYLVDQEGNRYGGAAAFRYLSRKLPHLWCVAPLMHVPFTLPLWQWMYRQVARRRYGLLQDSQCEDGVCKTHLE